MMTPPPPAGGGGGGRATWFQPRDAGMCVSKSEGHGSFFGFKGVQCVRMFHSKWVLNLLNMGKSLYLHIIITYTNGENALQSIQLYQVTKR